ncbi:MAG: sulfatase [Pseudomonadales bacterium]|nr:sulfatase [Pseudomonadales bacterium]
MKKTLKTLANISLITMMVIVTKPIMADTASASSAPNIVLVLADDMSWFDVGAYHQAIDYAPKNAITPNIDKIAEEGMMFTRSFTATAMCAVTRQQLYTGIYPVRNGAYGNHTRVYDGVKSAVHYFRDMGYRVGLAGKGHIFPKQAFPFERVGKENKGPDGESSFGIEQTRKFMARNKNQPFFLVVASANPHGPWNRGDTKQYPKDKLEIPVFLNDTPGLRHRLSQYLAEVTDLDREVGLLEAEIEKLGIKNETIFIFTSEQGSSLPFGKWTNYDSGLQTAFIIRWPNNISAGTSSEAMIEYVDVIPTLTDLVQGTVPENLDGKSFKPVLLGQESEHKEYVYGIQTSMNVHEGAPYPIRSIRGKHFKLIHNLMSDGKFSNVITQNPWFKDEIRAERKINKQNYSRYVKRPEFEFYDIVNDPFEQDNLIDQPQYKDQVAVLKDNLSAWMVQQGDLGIETELSVCERKGFSHRRCR